MLYVLDPYLKARVPLQFSETEDRFDLYAYRYDVAGDIYDLSNSKLYNYKYRSMFNVSSVFGAPYFATNPFYANMDSSSYELRSSISEYSNNSSPQDLTGSSTLQPFYSVEPYSGLVLESRLSYQMSFIVDANELTMDYATPYLLPYTTYSKHMTMNSGEANDLFADI